MRGLEDVFLKPDLLRYSDSNYEQERLQLQKTKYGIIIWNGFQFLPLLFPFIS